MLSSQNATFAVIFSERLDLHAYLNVTLRVIFRERQDISEYIGVIVYVRVICNKLNRTKYIYKVITCKMWSITEYVEVD